MNITVYADLSVNIVNDDQTLEFFLPNYDPNTMARFTSEEDATMCAQRMAGEPNTPWLPYKTPEEHEQERRAGAISLVNAHRDALFAETVDRINPLWWNDMTTEQQDEVTAFRADCLAVDQQDGYPYNVTWPAKPSVFNV